jgi:hypothetical protein
MIHNTEISTAELKADFIASFTDYFMEFMPFDAAFYLANSFLICHNMTKGSSYVVTRDGAIKDYLKKLHDLKVEKIEAIFSATKLPKRIGDYVITDDISGPVENFIQSERGNHYIVHTNDPSKIFVIRTNLRDKKVLQARDILWPLDAFYAVFEQRTDSASDLLSLIETGIDEDISRYRGRICEDTKADFHIGIGNVKTQLIEAKNPLDALEKSTHYYVKRDFKVEDGYTLLNGLNAKREDLERRLDILPTFQSGRD